MKRRPFIWAIAALFGFYCCIASGSCSSFPFGSSGSSAWAAGSGGKTMGTIRIASVSAERSNEWGSLENEISGLLPLLFLEEHYLVVSPDEKADYSADVKVREREYILGWKSRRSLSVELRLWAGEVNGPLPLAAGRALNHGNMSFASSKTLNAMLRKAVKNAVSGLPGRNGK